MNDGAKDKSSLCFALKTEGPLGQLRVPERTLRILILVDPQGLLYAAGRLLAHTGYPVNTVYEEGHAVASVLQHSNEPQLLVTSTHVSAGFCTARLIDRLRQLRYDACVTYCDCEGRSEVVDSYRRLPVNRFLTVPPEFRRSLLEAVNWLRCEANSSPVGLSIFEI